MSKKLSHYFNENCIFGECLIYISGVFEVSGYLSFTFVIILQYPKDIWVLCLNYMATTLLPLWLVSILLDQ